MKTEYMRQFNEKAADYLAALGEIKSDMEEHARRCEGDGDMMKHMRFDAARLLIGKAVENIEDVMVETDAIIFQKETTA